MKLDLQRVFSLMAGIFSIAAVCGQNNVAINNDGRSADPAAILDVSYAGPGPYKGVLIPRLTQAQRTALGAPGTLPQGLTIFQTDNTPGFYYVEYGQWNLMDIGGAGWQLTGNNISTPLSDFLGTRDDQDLVFRTNNAQVLRVEGTPGARYVRVGGGTGAPAEQLEVEGALRIFDPSPGTWLGTNPNTRFAATNTQGSILFRPSGTGSPGDSLQATFTPPGFAAGFQNRDIVMWSGHWGNINGIAPGGLATADAHSGGWRRLENPYEERFTIPYTQQGAPTCGAGVAELPLGSTSYSNGLAGAAELLMNPFKYDLAQRRWRTQYMFLRSELNVEANQLGGNTTATGGLCAGSAINVIGFWVNQGIGPNNPQRTLQITVTLKHAPLGMNNLTAGFDNSVDPAAGCFNNNALLFPAVGAAGWRTIGISPFVWDGVRNVIVEIAVASAFGGGGVAPGGLDVRYTNTGADLTYSSYTAPLYPGPNTPPCTPTTPTTNLCGPNNVATALGNCNLNGGAFGASQNRPVIQFGGTVATAAAAVSGNNSYLWYQGGLVVEGTTTPTPWGRSGNLGTAVPYSFRGPGTISAENGVYDNGVRLFDFVFDRYFEPASEEAAQDAHLPLEEMIEFTRTERHLPTMKGRADWERERGFSLGDLTNQLWVTAETQALYLTELNERTGILETAFGGKAPGTPGTAAVRALLATNQRLSVREKRRLVRWLDRQQQQENVIGP